MISLGDKLTNLVKEKHRYEDSSTKKKGILLQNHSHSLHLAFINTQMVRGNTWKNWRMDILWRENVKHAIQNSLKTLCHGFIETCKLKKSKNKICLKTWVNVNVFIVMNRDYKRMILWNLKLNMQNYLLDIWALANDMIQFSWKMETWSHAFQRVQSGCKPGT